MLTKGVRKILDSDKSNIEKFWGLYKLLDFQTDYSRVRTEEIMSDLAQEILKNYEVTPDSKNYKYKDYFLAMATGKTDHSGHMKKLYFQKAVDKKLYDELVKYTETPEKIAKQVKEPVTTENSDELQAGKLPALWELELEPLQNTNEVEEPKIQTPEIKR